jgi:hypothetical protein
MPSVSPLTIEPLITVTKETDSSDVLYMRKQGGDIQQAAVSENFVLAPDGKVDRRSIS